MPTNTLTNKEQNHNNKKLINLFTNTPRRETFKTRQGPKDFNVQVSNV